MAAQFKKGDKVRLLKTLNGHTFFTGEVVEVVHSLPAEAPDNYLGYVCKNEKGEQSAVGADEIELVQARVPKVGDKVKITDDEGLAYTLPEIKSEATVVKVHSDFDPDAPDNIYFEASFETLEGQREQLFGPHNYEVID